MSNQDENPTNVDQDVFSLQEIIDSEKEQTEIASAVLGASDAQNCSYTQGYVYRQALYCCLTCLNLTKEKKLHGICLACSYECHQNHELVELYTKRNFRCDCGNSKFSAFQCKLEAQKDPVNSLNKYNHNFNGLYCSCDRPYPDPDLSASDTLNNEEMIQCTICEDWFHLKHLNNFNDFKINENDYEDMVCQQCMTLTGFIWYYQELIALKDKSEASLVDVESVSEDCSGCKLERLKKMYARVGDKWCKSESSCFLADGWREALCKCENCQKMYSDLSIEFITKKEDSIKYYEERGKQMDEMNKEEVDEQKLLNNELSKMNRVSQLELLHNLNDFKTDLKEFLADFARNGQVVKRENIEEFFESLNNQRKKRRVQLY
ncbi:E3 ubiquitin- ligase UBR7 [Brachionus plicatilis]|uniref:E3 ubiquitin-ligase UBR7 n=1 Tax=Brachionus plicatilis TaxID=10195 RepID=A0A3M7RSB1_BRAPC|nr:E3 ubiquitin- ligase UBR7 [Brachionus plicatilis]